jgi:hypothetical protein
LEAGYENQECEKSSDMRWIADGADRMFAGAEIQGAERASGHRAGL